jgi:uncharacterized membrane protein
MRPSRPSPLQALVGLIFTTAGVLHFTHTRHYEATMPDYLPLHREAVLVSGVAEFAGGVGVLVPETRRYAGWGLIALLVAVFPANVQMALNPKDYKGIPAWALWLRLPFQGVFGWLVWRATAPSEG